MKNKKTVKYLLLSVISLLLSPAVMAENKQEVIDNDNYIQLQTNDKQSFSAYVVGPRNSQKGILLIHGWWGLTRSVENWANQFAVKGYRVMAIDLYNNKITKNPTKAKKLMASVKQSVANEKYSAAIKALSLHGRKIAVLGRSYGAAQTLHAASIGQEKISAVIIYYPYGKLITKMEKLELIKAPVLGHFASDDFFLTADKLDIFTSVIKKSNLNMTSNIYKAKHGFDKPTGNNYHEKAEKLSINRTYQFLRKHLN